MSKLYRSLFALHLFVGIGAIFGGMAAVLNPLEPLGMPLDPLKHSPFSNYLIPGIILFTVIGLGNMIGALTIIRKLKYQGYISGVFSGAIIIWIVVQCIMLRNVHFLHVLFFSIGVIGAVLALKVIFMEGLFPANQVRHYFDKLNKEA